MKHIIFPQILGTDQFMHCDGRWGMPRIKAEAKKQADRLNKHYKHRPITKAQLCGGKVSCPNVIAEFDLD